MKNKTKELLDRFLEQYNKREFLKTDPVQFAHRYDSLEDVEVVGLIASAFAYGNVRSMNDCLEKIFGQMGKNPYRFLRDSRRSDLQKKFGNFYYRFFSSEDIVCLLNSLSRFLREHQSISAAFQKHYAQSKSWETSLQALLFDILPMESRKTYGTKYFFSDPTTSTAKRVRLLMRWMVRKDEIDLGAWDFIARSELIVPLDTHIFNVSRKLKLLSSKTISRKASLTLTEKLKLFDPADPLKYDFALCRVGMFRTPIEQPRV